jgi:hypothetical protein
MPTSCARWVIAGTAAATVACGVEVVWDDSPYPDPRGAVLEFHCPAGLAAIGRPGQTALESIALHWSVGKGQSYLKDYVYLRLPDDLVSLSLVVDAGQHETAIRRLIHEQTVLLDATKEAHIGETAPFFHEPAPGSALLLPMGDAPAPTGGCLAVDPYAIGEYRGQTATLHVLSRRAASFAILPVDLVMVADTRMGAAEMDETFRTVDAIYRQHDGPRIGDLELRHLDWPSSTVALDGPEEYALRAAFRAQRFALTVYVVAAFDGEPDTLGISGSIPGANGIDGVASTGVIVALSSHEAASGAVDWELLGETIAHEAGHQLGLFHTTEAEGLDHDALADTPECPADRDADGDGEVSAEECAGAGGDNFMFWAMPDHAPQTASSARQATLLRLNPIVGVGSPRFGTEQELSTLGKPAQRVHTTRRCVRALGRYRVTEALTLTGRPTRSRRAAEAARGSPRAEAAAERAESEQASARWRNLPAD